MHIIEIPSFFIPYGGEFCLEQAKTLRKLGHEVRILSVVQLSLKKDVRSFVSLPFGLTEYQENDIPILQSYMRGIPLCVRRNVSRWVRNVHKLFRLYVEKYGVPDVIHAHCMKWAGYASMFLSHEYHIPYVVTEHLSLMDLQEEFGTEYSPQIWQIEWLKRAYRDADMVIPVAHEIVFATQRYYGSDYRWREISNVVDTAFFYRVDKQPMKGRTVIVCCVADFTYRKGYDILFKAFAKCREVVGDTLRLELHIAGKNTQSSTCKQMASNAEIEDFVVAYGKMDREGIRSLLHRSDLFVLASRSEVQPLVVLEAMSTGLPVVATTAVPQSERIDGACFVVELNDVDAMARQMCHVLKSRYFAEQYHTKDEVLSADDISEKVVELASTSRVGRQLENVFFDVCRCFSEK